MLFNSFEFLFIFLPIVFLVYWILPSVRQKTVFLTLSSYFFYGYWSFWFIFLMLGSTIIDYTIGLKLEKEDNIKKRKIYLLLSIIGNLGALAYFKYFNFFLGTVGYFSDFLDLGFNTPTLNILLPVGISFYTFQSMSYTIDLFRRKTKPTKDFWQFAAYVSMFPQLVAGPIVRHSELLYQFDVKNNINIRNINYDFIYKGLILFAIGMGKKILIADRIAEYINPMFDSYENLEFIGAWGAMIGYAYQIYFDFSGYSDMAIGLGLLFGFKLPQNFNSPYLSQNITDFWRRWHISLSAWLKDYLYISLGGNRISINRTYFNLMITMLLGGLWHGASWNFVIWGGIHGVLLALHKYSMKNRKTLNSNSGMKFVKSSLFFLIIVITWVFFRCETFNMSMKMLSSMFLFNGIGISWNDIYSVFAIIDPRLILLIMFSFLFINLVPNSSNLSFKKKYIYALFYPLILFICVLLFSQKMEFLYFQF